MTTDRENAERALNHLLKKAPQYTMTVELDQGEHRHLRFRIGESMIYGFDIVTWPGYLSISGDMGCYVFSRIKDMFEFFRCDEDGISPGYWSEKIQAADPHDGYEQFSPELFRANILEDLEQLEEAGDIEDFDDLKSQVEDEVLFYSEDGEAPAVQAAMGFMYEGRAIFPDFWETNNRQYTYRYLWCCYAIVWAIRQYDKQKLLEAA